MKTKRKVKVTAKNGRPSTYRPELCAQLIEHGKQGFSFESFAAVAGVTKKTLYNWLERFPEFVEAKEFHFVHCLRKWEQIAVGNATGTLKGSAAVTIHQMCNRFPMLFKNKIEFEHKEKKNPIDDLPDDKLQREIEELTAVVNASKS